MLYSFFKYLFAWFFQLFFRAEIIGKENLPQEGAVILAANHMSNWDPPLLACMQERPVAYMAKEELFEIPIFATGIRMCHAFPVKRGAADTGAIKAAVTVLKLGECLGVFPEGKRSKDGEIHKAEAGVALLAAMTGAPVLPVALIGTNKMFSKNTPFPTLTVICGTPMNFTGNRKKKEELEAFADSIMQEIARLKESIA